MLNLHEIQKSFNILCHQKYPVQFALDFALCANKCKYLDGDFDLKLFIITFVRKQNVWWAHYLIVLSGSLFFVQTGCETADLFYFHFCLILFRYYWRICSLNRTTLIPCPSFWLFFVSKLFAFVMMAKGFISKINHSNTFGRSEKNFRFRIQLNFCRQANKNRSLKSKQTKKYIFDKISAYQSFGRAQTIPRTQQNIQQASEGSVKTLTSKVHSDLYCLSPRIRHSSFVCSFCHRFESNAADLLEYFPFTN